MALSVRKIPPKLINKAWASVHTLLCKFTKWKWEKEQEDAFAEGKGSFRVILLLIHFDVTKQLLLACDSSPYGVRTVLSHELEIKSDASRTLTAAKNGYPPTGQRMLARS